MMTKTDPNTPSEKRHSNIFLAFLSFLCLFFFVAFMSLGFWQVQRLGWKNNLIAQVNDRVHRAPVAAPPKAQWQTLTNDKDEYLPVQITGTFLNDKEVLVTAVAQETTGYWVVTPLQSADGTITFINRGFVPMEKRAVSMRKAGNIEGVTTVIGLLRMSEGGGFFPRKNNPETNTWYTRQLPEMAKKLGINNVAPYFIDADKTQNIGGLPIGGLTIIHFPNSHLVYLITWFLLAAGVLGASIFIFISEKRRRRGEDLD